MINDMITSKNSRIYQITSKNTSHNISHERGGYKDKNNASNGRHDKEIFTSVYAPYRRFNVGAWHGISHDE